MWCNCGTSWRCFRLFFTGENASSLLVTDCWSPQKGPAVWISRACCCCGISVRSIGSSLIDSFISNICNLFLKSSLRLIFFFLLCLLLIESRLTNLKNAWLTYTSHLLHVKHLLKKTYESETKSNERKNWIWLFFSLIDYYVFYKEIYIYTKTETYLNKCWYFIWEYFYVFLYFVS